MKLLERVAINDQAWNDCIDASQTSLVYAYSWYLDEIAPKWKGLVIEKNGKYLACFPVPWNKKWGITYVYPPFFAQQLGLFSSDSNYNIDLFLKFLRKEFSFIELYLNHTNQGRNLQVKDNQILRLNKPYEELYRDYRNNHQRNLKKHINKVRIEESGEVKAIVSLFKHDRGKSVKTLKASHFLAFENTCLALKNKGKLLVLSAFDKNNILVTGGIFIVHQNRITFIFSGNSTKGKKYTSLFILLDFVIKKYANSGYVLDFEGSSNPGIRRFYRGFGAGDEQYFFKKINNLPFPLNLFKK